MLAGDNVHRVPIQTSSSANALRGELGPCELDQHISSGSFEIDNLRVDSWIGEFVAQLLDYHAGRLVAETLL
ncbi:hypothetical protein AC630_26845 [Bradyrhizobium sp. AS23.2]|nr:hypothetical protein AC630_26845 [Bradyrhizobium sp. AS23.2]